MQQLLSPPADHDAQRWPHLAAALAVDPRAPVVLGFSGGADSRLLLHWLSVSEPRPRVIAVHVNHGLRGNESERDAAFCAETCRAAGIELRVRRVALDSAPQGLEQRAREARYRVLLREARLAKVRWVVTAHQADDSFETTLLRWVRGSDLEGLRGIESEVQLGGPRIVILRPLLGLRREEVRALAERAGLEWRDDASNCDPRFARARLREHLLPALERVGGTNALEGLRDFASAVDSLERRLADRTAVLEWSPLPARAATRRPETALLGGSLRRRAIDSLPPLLRRRALWRLLVDATARAPGRKLLARLEGALDASACLRMTLPGGWQLALRTQCLELHPPALRLAKRETAPELPFDAARTSDTRTERRLQRPNDARWPDQELPLTVPGAVRLPDGRRITARWVEADATRPVPRDACRVELALPREVRRLLVRAPLHGDRMHPLGALGSRAVARILADARVPRAERGSVPLVLWNDAIVWIAGLRPAESARVHAHTSLRLRLELVGGPASAPVRPWARPDDRMRVHQGEFDFAPRPARES